MDNQSYTWTDNPTVSGVSPCNTDVLNECLMHLKYNQQNGDGFRLFDIKITDRKLVGEEAVGWVIQGGLVTMTYPDAVNKIIEEFDEGVPVTQRDISCVQSLTGHYIADIEQKDAIDQLFAQTGIADFYILDKTNQQFYLPRNKWFMQLTTDDTLLNQHNEAGLPNISGTVKSGARGGDYMSGSFYLHDSNNNGVSGKHDGGSDANYTAGTAGFDASRSSAIYGKSDTVQPQSSNKLVYYKVGNISTSTNQILIDAQEFLADSVQELENTAQEGLDSIETTINEGAAYISSVSNALNQTQITDCILAAPNGVASFTTDTITLKQGLKMLIPNGRNSDGTLNNIVYTLPEDLSKTLTTFSNTSDNVFFVYNEENADISLISTQKTEYGLLENRPDNGNAIIYYATDTNCWYQYNENAWDAVYVCKVGVAQQSTSAITSLYILQPERLLGYNAREFLSHQANPSNYIVGLSTPVNGQTVIAPADGYFTLSATCNGKDVITGLYNNTSGIRCQEHHGGTLVCFVPASKGDSISPLLQTNDGGYSNRYLSFTYSNGGKPND